jgi:hypothetical protein
MSADIRLAKPRKTARPVPVAEEPADPARDGPLAASGLGEEPDGRDCFPFHPNFVRRIPAQPNQEVCRQTRGKRVLTNRRDFPGPEIARHFRRLCAENRSLRSFGRVQATFLVAAFPKSLAANFSFPELLCAKSRSRAIPSGHSRQTLARIEPFKGLIDLYAQDGGSSPSARHWSGHAIGRSTRRLNHGVGVPRLRP